MVSTQEESRRPLKMNMRHVKMGLNYESHKFTFKHIFIVTSRENLVVRLIKRIMSPKRVIKLTKEDSLSDFEFLDAEGDLDIDLSISPRKGAAEELGSGFGPIISTLGSIIEEQRMTASLPVRTIATTATTAAVGALTGSLLGGPSGLAVGLITGVVVAIRSSPNCIKKSDSEEPKSTIRQIFGKMTVQQKKELLKELLSCLKESNVRILVVEILKNEGIRKMALEILSSFLMKKIGVSLVRSK